MTELLHVRYITRKIAALKLPFSIYLFNISLTLASKTFSVSGLLSLTYFLGFLSINLAVFNLLPFPALDGGWTVILLIELITRRKVPDKIVGAVNYVGFMVLIGFMIVVTLKDILFPISL